MNTVLKLVIYMAALTWLTLLAASLIRARGWTLPGMLIALGNRDNLPEATALAGRAERTARNTLENFVLFVAIAFVTQFVAPTNPQAALGAQVFFWARVLFVPVYYVGIPFVRTAVWAISIFGLGMMVHAVF